MIMTYFTPSAIPNRRQCFRRRTTAPGNLRQRALSFLNTVSQYCITAEVPLLYVIVDLSKAFACTEYLRNL